MRLKDDIETTFVSEWDEPAQRTYKLNYPGAEIAGDITQIDEKDIPEFDICLAGFSMPGILYGWKTWRVRR